MVNTKAREIVENAEARGLGPAQIAEICEVSMGTVFRWKSTGRATGYVIAKLENHLNSLNPKPDNNSPRKYLDECSLEDLAKRARDLGFRITFQDINEIKNQEEKS